MNLLEYFYNQQYFSNAFIPRKCIVPTDVDINLFGVRGSGKSSILLDIYENSKKDLSLYIDFNDPICTFKKITTLELQSFININNIELLIFDHYEENTLMSMPNVKQIIVASRYKLDIVNFYTIELFLLDYEEFLAFDLTSSQKHGFHHFLQSGTFPIVAKSQKDRVEILKNFFYGKFSQNEQKLLIILANNHTKHITAHQIYNYAKEQFKVSKDWIYKTIREFTNEKVITFAEDRYIKTGKKMILFDFALAKYLNPNHTFMIQFDTLVSLALMKHNIYVDTLGIYGYITKDNELLVPAPFESEESLWSKSQNRFSTYKKHNVNKVTVITISNSYKFRIEKLLFEAIPFEEWSILSNEE